MVSVTRIVCCFRVAESMRGEEDVDGGGGGGVRVVSVTRIVCCFRVAESMRGEEDVEGGGVVSEWLA